MADQQHFEQIYFNTYQKVLKYIVMHCTNIEDVNDIVQEAYIELYNLLDKEKVILKDDLSPYVIGIAKNKMKDFYRKKNKFSFFSSKISNDSEEELDILDIIPSDIDIEDIIIKGDLIEKAWNFIKQKKVIIGRIFYLHYYLGMPIKDIAHELKMNESTIKNHLYRTLKEMHNYFVEGGKVHV